MSSVSTTAMPLAFAHLSREEVARLNRVHRWGAPLPLPGSEHFSLQPLEADETILPRGDRLHLLFTVAGSRFRANLPRPLMMDLVQSLDSRLKLDPLPPPDLAALLLESALLPLVYALERGTGGAVTLEDLTSRAEGPMPGTDARAVRSFLLSGVGLHQLLAVEGTPDAVERLLENWPRGRRPLGGLPVPVRLCYGSTMLTPRLLRSLRIGDAVLIQQSETVLTPEGGASAAVLRVSDCLGATVRRVGSGWRIEAPLHAFGWAGQDVSENASSAGGDRSEQNAAPEASAAPGPGETALDAIPVRLQFEAGRLELSLGALRGLGAGSVLEFGGEPGRVAILSGGRRIGDGTLVSIEGRAGVRIDGFADGLDAGMPA